MIFQVGEEWFNDKKRLKFLEMICEYEEFLDVIEVILKGRVKHGDSWLKADGATMSLNENCSSLFRHLAKKQAGETLDKESNLDHDLHIACRALMSYTRKKRKLAHSKDICVSYTIADGSGCIGMEEHLEKHKNSQYSRPQDSEDNHQL